MLFNEHAANGPLSGLSNEVLCILAAQGAAKLPNVKAGGLKKNSAAQPNLL